MVRNSGKLVGAKDELAGNSAKNDLQRPWFTYVVRCSDGSLYTGLALDVAARLLMHNSGKGASYTRGRGPVSLVYFEKFATHREAAQRECEIKKLKREEKERLIGGAI